MPITLSRVLQPQQHASKASTAREEPPLWTVPCPAHSSKSSTVIVAKRLYPYHKQFKLLDQSQGNVKRNSKKRQHANLLRYTYMSCCCVSNLCTARCWYAVQHLSWCCRGRGAMELRHSNKCSSAVDSLSGSITRPQNSCASMTSRLNATPICKKVNSLTLCCCSETCTIVQFA